MHPRASLDDMMKLKFFTLLGLPVLWFNMEITDQVFIFFFKITRQTQYFKKLHEQPYLTYNLEETTLKLTCSFENQKLFAVEDRKYYFLFQLTKKNKTS